MAVLVGVAEHNTRERGTTAGIVDDLADNALHVAITLREVVCAVLGCSLAVGEVDAGQHTPLLSLPLASDNLSHCESWIC